LTRLCYKHNLFLIIYFNGQREMPTRSFTHPAPIASTHPNMHKGTSETGKWLNQTE
jgi:hypothetical protein